MANHRYYIQRTEVIRNFPVLISVGMAHPTIQKTTAWARPTLPDAVDEIGFVDGFDV